jgi:hypothetical protein
MGRHGDGAVDSQVPGRLTKSSIELRRMVDPDVGVFFPIDLHQSGRSRGDGWVVEISAGQQSLKTPRIPKREKTPQARLEDLLGR